MLCKNFIISNIICLNIVCLIIVFSALVIKQISNSIQVSAPNEFILYETTNNIHINNSTFPPWNVGLNLEKSI